MRMRKSTDDLPPAPIQDIRRVTSIKILGITITNHLSVGDHVRDAVSYTHLTLPTKRIV